MRRFGSFIVVAAACATGAADAQEAAGSETGLSGKAAFGYLATSGNTESTNTNATLSLDYTLPIWRHVFTSGFVGASSAEATTAESYRAAYEARRAFGEHGYVFTALDWKRDRFSGFAEQISETVGYGRRLLDRERHVLDGGLGVGARQAELRDGTEEDDQIVRGSLDYLWTVSETTEFEQQLVIESGSTNTSTEALSALRARLFGNISLVLSYRLKHNSDVPDGAVESDRFSSISLEYAW